MPEREHLSGVLLHTLRGSRPARWIRPLLLGLAAAVLLLAATDVVFAQCAMCRTALARSPEGARLASGFNQGILFLLGTPFLISGMMVVRILRANQKRGRNGRASTG